MSIAAHGNIDDAGVVGADILIAKTEARQGSRPEILHNHIGLPAHRGDDFARFRIIEVDAQVSFAGILLDIIHPEAIDMRQADPAEIARGWFDLGDVGAEVTQRLGAMRPCQHAGKVDDTQSLQRSRHFQSPSKTALAGPVAKKASKPR